MEYSQFLDDVKKSIEWKVDDEYDVKINRIMKNNSIELDGVVFFRKGENISPNIYLNSYFDRYQKGESVDVIANEIIKIYYSAMHEQEVDSYNIQRSFAAMHSFIIYRLVNYAKNRKLLEEVPHIRFLDLAITFHCLVKHDDNGIGTVRITTEHMQEWKTSVKELMRFAIVNTPKIFPIKIRTMNEVIREILKKDIFEMFDQYDISFDDEAVLNDIEKTANASLNKMMEKSQSGKEAPMYIMTNSNGINGASVLLYQDAMKNFAKERESDFYVLPSSIHEIILVPFQESLDRETLSGMVLDVNRTQVPAEEILSNKVYLYKRETNSFEF